MTEDISWKPARIEFGGERCFGILANMDFILVYTYEKMAKIRNYFFTKRDDCSLTEKLNSVKC